MIVMNTFSLHVCKNLEPYGSVCCKWMQPCRVVTKTRNKMEQTILFHPDYSVPFLSGVLALIDVHVQYPTLDSKNLHLCITITKSKQQNHSVWPGFGAVTKSWNRMECSVISSSLRKNFNQG